MNIQAQHQAVGLRFGNTMKPGASLPGFSMSGMAGAGAAMAPDSVNLRFGRKSSSMIEINAPFRSGGETLDGTFFYPKNPKPADAKKPIVVICSGYQGVKNFHPRRVAEALTKLGYPCFGFDYKGFGKSTGERGAVTMEGQTEDIRNAVLTAKARADQEGRPVRLLGWGMAGGMVLDAMKDPAVNAAVEGVAPLNGFFDAVRVQKEVRGEEGYQEFLRTMATPPATENAKVDPFDIYPLRQGDTTGYVNAELSKHADEGYRTPVNRSFWDSLKNFKPEADLSHLRDKPVLVVHGDQNDLHNPQEARSLSSKLNESGNTNNEMFWLPDAGHTEWMFGDHPTFQMMINKLDEWMQRTGSTAAEAQ